MPPFFSQILSISFILLYFQHQSSNFFYVTFVCMLIFIEMLWLVLDLCTVYTCMANLFKYIGLNFLFSAHSHWGTLCLDKCVFMTSTMDSLFSDRLLFTGYIFYIMYLLYVYGAVYFRYLLCCHSNLRRIYSLWAVFAVLWWRQWIVIYKIIKWIATSTAVGIGMK
jgi:hypothetical protein